MARDTDRAPHSAVHLALCAHKSPAKRTATGASASRAQDNGVDAYPRRWPTHRCAARSIQHGSTMVRWIRRSNLDCVARYCGHDRVARGAASSARTRRGRTPGCRCRAVGLMAAPRELRLEQTWLMRNPVLHQQPRSAKAVADAAPPSCQPGAAEGLDGRFVDCGLAGADVVAAGATSSCQMPWQRPNRRRETVPWALGPGDVAVRRCIVLTRCLVLEVLQWR